jgi:hypothetical protein
MRTAVKVALITLLGCGGLLSVLGLLIWAGGWELIDAHKLLGYMGAIWWGRRLVGLMRQARTAAERTIAHTSVPSSVSG